jgi:hypothetical protein
VDVEPIPVAPPRDERAERWAKALREYQESEAESHRRRYGSPPPIMVWE